MSFTGAEVISPFNLPAQIDMMDSPITESTSLSITFGLATTGVTILIAVTWRVANLLRDIRDEMKRMNEKIEEVAADSWRTSAMERWANTLRWENREKGLIVPDPRASESSAPFIGRANAE